MPAPAGTGLGKGTTASKTAGFVVLVALLTTCLAFTAVPSAHAAANAWPHRVVAGFSTPNGKGYWLFASDGGVFTFGDAHFFGSASGLTRLDPIVGAVTSPGDNGYELLTRGGGHFDFGKVHILWPQRGWDHGVTTLSVAPTPTHKGFWALLKDSGVGAMGDAHLYGPVWRNLPRGTRYIFSNPKHDGYILIATSGKLVRRGQAPGH